MAKIITAKEAAELIKDGDNIAIATFGASGTPEEILMAVEKRFLETGHPKDIGYTHAAGGGSFALNGGKDADGVFRCRAEDHMAHEGLMARWYCSHVACSDETSRLLTENKIAGWCMPLGTILQIYKDQARGMNSTLSKVGLGTYVDPRFDGGAINDKARNYPEQWVDYVPDFFGEEYLRFRGLPLNIGWMRGTTADKSGNISCESEPYNLEMLTIAQAVTAFNGKVFVEVEKVVETGEINPKMVKVPGLYVDYIVVEEHPQDKMSTVGGFYNPEFTGQKKANTADMGKAEKIPLNGNKVLLRRAAMEVQKGMYANFGLGMPQQVGGIIAEEGIGGDYLTMLSESGAAGGVPASGTNFGAHYNVESLTDQGDHFNFFDAGGIDIAMFGLSEVDPHGDMNVSILNGSLKGVGGFMNIACGAKKIVILGTFTAAGIKTDVKDGKLVITKEGKYKKFVNKLVQNAFDARTILKKGTPIMFVTERAVFHVTPDGLMLTEIAPGIDLQTQVLDMMEFKPLMPEGGPKLMSAELFKEEGGKLKEIIDAKGSIR